MPVRFFVAAMIVSVAPWAAPVRADTVVADNFTPTFTGSGFRTDVGYAGNPNFTNEAPAQRFIPSESGTLTSVTTYIQRWRAPEATPDLHVSIRADQGGMPGAVLGEQSFPAAGFATSYFPPNPPLTFDLSSLNVPLLAGQPYHVVFRTDTALAGDFYYSLHVLRPHAGSFGSDYVDSPDGGATWGVRAGSGLEIPVQVQAVPEPASGLLAVGALAWAAGPRRRSR